MENKMKALALAALLSVFGFFIFYGMQGVYSQSPAQPQPLAPQAPAEDPSPTIEDYEKFLTKIENMGKNFMVFDSWKEMSFKHKVTGKVVEWKDLSDYEKTMFCLIMAERTSAYFTKMNTYWQNELKEFDDPNHKLVPTPNPENDKQKPATKEDVKKYVEKLTTLRKNFAVEYEKFAEKSLKTYEKEIPQPEREKMLKSMRDYHDKHKLVERK
jgi:hypothetical protein